ncbi:MAG: hypothetical protein LBB52_03225 [Desulfovibrio sp.]|jgi:hypothetical protein|nr:hypothetical protein [Desulfovibrio sp.]
MKMTTGWIIYTIIGVAASAYGFYLLYKDKRHRGLTRIAAKAPFTGNAPGQINIGNEQLARAGICLRTPARGMPAGG